MSDRGKSHTDPGRSAAPRSGAIKKVTGPTLIEALTYRQSGHSRADPATYRPDGELDTWLDRDPLQVAARRLRDMGVEQSVLDEVRRSAEQTVRAAADRALSWSEPTPDARLDDVWKSR